MRTRATIMGIVLAGYRPVVQPWQRRPGAFLMERKMLKGIQARAARP